MAPQIKLSINLVQAALKELQFLELVDQHPALYFGSHMKNSIRRYELFWLPLAAQSYADEIAAPLDVAWVWHVHMLAPQDYEQDCNSVVSTTVDHELMVGKRREKGLAHARGLWELLYPREPFEINLKIQPKLPEYTSRIGYDIASASARQRAFFYQVSLPHYRDVKFLRSAVERYKQHLLLKKRNPDTLLVPCYDFDLIWHAHQVHPLDYREDMLAALGRVLNHDDSMNDRSLGSKLTTSQADTCSLWEKAGWIFPVNGAMFRGIPPVTTFHSRAPGKYSTLAALTYDVELLNFEAENLEEGKQYVIQLGVINGQSICKKKFRGPSGAYKRDKPISKFQFHTEYNNCIQAQTSLENFCACLGQSVCDSGRIYFTDKLNSVSYGSSMTHTIRFDGDDKVVNFTVRVYPPRLSRYFFAVQAPRHFTPVQDPDDVLSYPNLFISPVRVDGTSSDCEMSIQRILDYRNVEAFSYRVMHSATLLFSSVEIFDLNKNVMASAHLLRNDVVPCTGQVAKGDLCCTLEEGERAVLIRGERDWGLCVGRWEGFVSREPDEEDEETNAVRVRGEPGHLEIKFFSLHKKSQSWQAVRRNGFTYRVFPTDDTNSSVDVDLRLGFIVFPPQLDDIPESLALGVSIALLHLLCQPHPARNTSIPSAPAVSIGDKLTKPRSIDNEELLLVVAAGYYSNTVPTSSYLSHTSGACGGCGGCGGC